MTLEGMEALCKSLSAEKAALTSLALDSAQADFASDWQSMLWTDCLVFAAVGVCDWTAGERRYELFRAFADVEQVFLSRYYTAEAAERFAQMLREQGVERVVLTDLCRDDMAEAIEDAFRMDRMVVCASSYDAAVFPPMHTFLWKLQQKAYQKRTVGIVENGSWAPSAGKEMRALLEPMKDIRIVEPMVTIRSRMNAESEAMLRQLAQTIAQA